MTLNTFKSEIGQEFLNLLDFWMNYSLDEKNGGFLGSIDLENKPMYTEKSVVATARILWGFSASIDFIKTQPGLQREASRIPELDKLAKKAFDYLIDRFWDKTSDGVYWNVTPEGNPRERKKIIYGHSFFVYGMSEYYRATGYKPALEWAKKGFDAIVDHAYDKKYGGYLEGFSSDWSETDNYVLSSGKWKKSMNTHLHLLECFANLYRVDKSEDVRFHLEHCIDIMLKRVIGEKKSRMTLFFTSDWQPKDKTISYGHDIEASWLLLESAEILGNEHLIKLCKAKCLEMARYAADGLRMDKGMIYELNPKTNFFSTNRDWWVMAEAMVGFYNAYQLSGKVHFLQKSENCWEFIKAYLIDHNGGEWWSSVDENHKVLSNTKANPWKAPYHNLRACMEIYRRV
jgi:mannobiose 2-epimerase